VHKNVFMAFNPLLLHVFFLFLSISSFDNILPWTYNWQEWKKKLRTLD
jgi:hypothetical protein